MCRGTPGPTERWRDTGAARKSLRTTGRRRQLAVAWRAIRGVRFRSRRPRREEAPLASGPRGGRGSPRWGAHAAAATARVDGARAVPSSHVKHALSPSHHTGRDQGRLGVDARRRDGRHPRARRAVSLRRHGHGVPRRRGEARRRPELERLRVPDAAVQRGPAEDHPARHQLLRRERRDAGRGLLLLPVQL